MEEHQKSIKEQEKRDQEGKCNNKKFIAITIIYIGLLIACTSFLRIPFRFNTAITYSIVVQMHVASILIFSAGIMYKPWSAFFICVLGSVLGEFLQCLMFGCGEEMPAYLMYMILSPGLAGGIISLVKEKLNPTLKKEIISQLIGATWQIFGLLLGVIIWLALILQFRNVLVIVFYPLLATIFDFFFIPVSILLNEIIRRVLKVKYVSDLVE